MRDGALVLILAALYLVGSGTEPRPETDAIRGTATTSSVEASTELVLGVRDGREGTITHMGAGYPASYLAIPIGPGHRVKVCGPATCLTLTSTDAGPNRAMLQAGRIADVSVQTFERLCGCPSSRGTFRGSWKLVGSAPVPTLPPTDSE